MYPSALVTVSVPLFTVTTSLAMLAMLRVIAYSPTGEVSSASVINVGVPTILPCCAEVYVNVGFSAPYLRSALLMVITIGSTTLTMFCAPTLVAPYTRAYTAAEVAVIVSACLPPIVS